MRLSFAPLLLFSSLALASCSSSGVMDDFQSPSNETTNAIRPSAPVASVDEVIAARVVQPVRTMPKQRAAPAPVEVAADLPMPEQTEDAQTLAALAPVPRQPKFKPLQAEKAVMKALMDGATIHRRRFRDAKPINFGKTNPRNLAVHGVDVSRWQGDINWPKLRTQGANFAYIKATDGGDHLDPMFKTNWREARAAGLKVGAYHFFYWCRNASSQADWFIRNVPRVAGALPPVIDVEWNHQSSCKKRPSRAVVLEKMQVFMDKLEAHYGQRPVIYTAPDFYSDNLKGAFPNHPFWLRSVAAHPSKRYPGRKWLFWQYSGSGLSHGVSGKIDLNAFHGSEEDWRRWVTRVSG